MLNPIDKDIAKAVFILSIAAGINNLLLPSPYGSVNTILILLLLPLCEKIKNKINMENSVAAASENRVALVNDNNLFQKHFDSKIMAKINSNSPRPYKQ